METSMVDELQRLCSQLQKENEDLKRRLAEGTPSRKVGCITVVVDNYDDAIDHYCRQLQFQLRADTPLGQGKRWVLVAPSDSSETCLLLAEAADPEQTARIGDQTGGRVFLFLHTDDFHRDFERMKQCGVCFLETPRHEPYGVVAVFVDKYGNKWDLLQLNK